MSVRIVVMGPSGSGKSTVGAVLADALGARFIDGDDLHPAANVRKMAAGIPLDDADRQPWLRLVGETLQAEERMRLRADHFMPAALLDSQLQTLESLEADEHGIRVDESADVRTASAVIAAAARLPR